MCNASQEFILRHVELVDYILIWNMLCFQESIEIVRNELILFMYLWCIFPMCFAAENQMMEPKPLNTTRITNGIEEITFKIWLRKWSWLMTAMAPPQTSPGSADVG